MRELHLGFTEMCKNCGGHGVFKLIGFNSDQIASFAKSNNAIVSELKSYECICLECNGDGYTELPTLELEQTC